MNPSRPESAAGPPRLRVARPDRTFAWFIGGSFVTALAGGFALALLLPLSEIAGWSWGIRRPALIQAHGHLQVAGWVGLFVCGMALRLAPRFAGRPLRFAALTPAIFVLLIVALPVRALAQPWLDVAGMHALLLAGAAAELLAALLFAIAIVATVAPAARTLPVAPFFLLGALGFLAQAALGALWLPGLSASLPILPPERDTALLSLQFYGFLLPFVFAVSLRSLPSFFKYRPPVPRNVWALAAALAAGVALAAAGAATAVRAVQAIGSLLIAAAIVGALLNTGVWRQPLGLRPSARHAVLLIRTVCLWLLLSAALLAVDAGVALGRVSAAPPVAPDAIRHMLALGVFSTMIAGMAPLMLPRLAQRRQQQERAERETLTLWALFTLAAILRVAGALLERSIAAPVSVWLIAVSGVLGFAAVLFLAITVLRAARSGSVLTVTPRAP